MKAKKVITRKKTITVVTSCLNEAKNVEELYRRLKNVFNKEKYLWNLIIFDNGSKDKTWDEILALSRTNKNIVGYRMSRTFSLDAVFTSGLLECTGDAVIMMASDLQDPPETIPALLRCWERGVPHVAVKIKDRAEMSKTRRVLTKNFYRISKWASDGLIPENVSDFRLMDQAVYKAVNELTERNRFMRGLVAWTGFPTEFVEIERPPRFSGRSAANYPGLIRFALQGIFANSIKPLSAISILGVISALLSVLSLLFFIPYWILTGVPFAGFGTIIGFIALGFSIIVLMLGLLAEYLGLVYGEVKMRPHVVRWDSTN
jgi:dolichol-phosphate mannosyltransferase